VPRRRLLALAAAASAFALATACSENLTEGRACPSLCPNQNIPVHDTTIDGLDGLALDTTVTGYPPLGQEPALLVASRGDSLDVRGIIRFDSIPVNFKPTSSDTLRPAKIAFEPRVRLKVDTSRESFPRTGPVTFAAYDVDTVGNDTTVAVLASLFRPDRFLGQATLPLAQGGSLQPDSVIIPLDSGRIAAHVRGDRLVRIGIRLVATGRIDVDNTAGGTGLEPIFTYRPSTDTAHVSAFTVVPRSTTPANLPGLAASLTTYPLVVIGSSPPIGPELDVGGVPARRTLLRFRLPSIIVDSATVVRATLTLHPTGLRGGFLPTDSLTLFPQGIISTADVTDPTRQALFTAPSTLIGIDTVRVAITALDSVNIEFVNAVRRWSRHSTDSVARAIVVRIAREGANPLLASFFNSASTVPAAQRPHIHLSYINRVGFGLP
jgi:hypothetical protein